MTHLTHYEALRERIEELNANLTKAYNARNKAYEARFKADEVVTESGVIFERVIAAGNTTKEEHQMAKKDQITAYRAYQVRCEACNAARIYCSDAYRALLEIKAKAEYVQLRCPQA